MAEYSKIETKILKNGHLSTNITEKSSEDLIDSPGCLMKYKLQNVYNFLQGDINFICVINHIE